MSYPCPNCNNEVDEAFDTCPFCKHPLLQDTDEEAHEVDEVVNDTSAEDKAKAEVKDSIVRGEVDIKQEGNSDISVDTTKVARSGKVSISSTSQSTNARAMKEGDAAAEIHDDSSISLESAIIRGEVNISKTNVTNVYQGEPDGEKKSEYASRIYFFLEKDGPEALNLNRKAIQEIRSQFQLDKLTFDKIEKDAKDQYLYELKERKNLSKYRVMDNRDEILTDTLTADEVVEFLNEQKITDYVPRVDIEEDGIWRNVWNVYEIFSHDYLKFYCAGSGQEIPRDLVHQCHSCGKVYENSYFEPSHPDTCSSCVEKQELERQRLEEERINEEAAARTLTLDPMQWKHIPADEFWMGSPLEEEGRDDDEWHHYVLLTRDFLMTPTLVSEKLFGEIMGRQHGDDRDTRAATNVSWLDAIEFCNKWSEKLGLNPCYEISSDHKVTWHREKYGVRLLTEAEWEYACRAGSESSHYPSSDNDLEDIAWFDAEEEIDFADHEPNPFGLYDMLGTVWEWVWDDEHPYPREEVVDPATDSQGDTKVIRGGSRVDAAEVIRAANREFSNANSRSSLIGFRVAVTLKQEKEAPIELPVEEYA